MNRSSWRTSAGRCSSRLRRAGLTAALSLGLVLAITAGPGSTHNADAQTSCPATDEATLAGCITSYNAAATGTTLTINLANNVPLFSELPMIDNGAVPPARLVINGGGYDIDGRYFTSSGVTWDVLNMVAGDLLLSNVELRRSAPDKAGLRVTGGSTVIVASALVDNGYGLLAGGDTAELRDTTVAENSKTGVVLFGGELVIERSTIAANEISGVAWFFGDAITFQGSLIARNADQECVGPGFSAAADLGGNVIEDGFCGVPSTPAVASWNPSLTYSGCSIASCTASLRRLPEPAIDANSACGPGLVDQWSRARTAGKCDAGAAEYGDCSTNVAVVERSDLEVASLCYRRLAAGETLAVSIQADLSLSPVYLSNSASPPPQFLVDGGGHTLSFPGFPVSSFQLQSGHLGLSNIALDLAGVSVQGGFATIDNSTVSSSFAGLYSSSSELSVVRNSTFADNTYGIYVNGGGAVNVERSTMVDNSNQGVRNFDTGAVALQGSLVAGNGGSTECTGTGFLDLGGNAFEDASCGGPAMSGLAGSFAGLFDNGCVTAPCTRTVALIPGSPAIDANTSCGAGLLDQRGTPRLAGACDAGAFELPGAPVFCNGLTVTINMQLGALGTGTVGNDVILGTAGDDVIDALEGDDTVCAGGGNDQVLGGPGDDTIDGGDGDDKLFGHQGADTIDGGPGNDTIHGNKGDDVLNGGAGDDRIFGYANNDTIDGGPGADRLHGNFGNDIVNGGDGDDRMFGYGDDDVLNGGAGDDLIGGNFGDDTINGGSGHDTIYGSDGNDIVNGNAGNDSVAGNSLNDTVTGGPGDDALDGGIGVDTCNGGPDTDTATRCETIVGVP